MRLAGPSSPEVWRYTTYKSIIYKETFTITRKKKTYLYPNIPKLDLNILLTILNDINLGCLAFYNILMLRNGLSIFLSMGNIQPPHPFKTTYQIANCGLEGTIHLETKDRCFFFHGLKSTRCGCTRKPWF